MKDFVTSFVTIDGLSYFNVIVTCKAMGNVVGELRDQDFKVKHVTYCAQLVPAE